MVQTNLHYLASISHQQGRWQAKTVIVVALAMSGCMKHVQVHHATIVIPASCITEMKPLSDCEGPDREHLHCDKVAVIHYADCEQFHVVKSK